MKRLCALFLVFGCSSLVRAELPHDITAKLLKALANGAKVSCRDEGLRAALQAAGVEVSTDAPIVWVSNPMEAKGVKTMGRLGVGSRRELLNSGAGVVIFDDGGRPKIMLNTANIQASKTGVSDAILKVGERL